MIFLDSRQVILQLFDSSGKCFFGQQNILHGCREKNVLMVVEPFEEKFCDNKTLLKTFRLKYPYALLVRIFVLLRQSFEKEAILLFTATFTCRGSIAFLPQAKCCVYSSFVGQTLGSKHQNSFEKLFNCPSSLITRTLNT